MTQVYISRMQFCLIKWGRRGPASTDGGGMGETRCECVAVLKCQVVRESLGHKSRVNLNIPRWHLFLEYDQKYFKYN